MEIRKEQFLAAVMALGLGATACSKDEAPAEDTTEETAGAEETTETEPMMEPEPIAEEPMAEEEEPMEEEVYEPAAE